MNHGLAQVVENRLKESQQRHRRANNRKCIVSLVVDDLIRQYSPKNDRRQTEKTEDHRANKDVARDPPLTKQQSCDQTNTERLRFIRDRIVAFDENDLTGPDTFKT